MTALDAIILGLVEGITEYLPVSSTGHLIVTERLLGIGMGEEKQVADAFAICIQAGAIVAVLGLYYRRVLQMARASKGATLYTVPGLSSHGVLSNESLRMPYGSPLILGEARRSVQNEYARSRNRRNQGCP